MDINEDALNGMTDNEKAEFAIWQELLESKGFALLTEFLSGQKEVLVNTLLYPNNWEEHLYARGKRDGLDTVLNLQALLEGRIAEMAEVEEDEFQEILEL